MIWIWALMGIGVAAVAAKAKRSKRGKVSARALAPHAVLRAFSTTRRDAYPAPYTYAHARELGDWLLSTIQHPAPYIAERVALVRSRRARIESAMMSDADKTLATIWGVIVPALSEAFPWWWWRDPPSPEKTEQISAIVLWLGFFFIGPQTATVAAGATYDGPGYATIDGIFSGWDAGPISAGAVWRGGLSPLLQRRALMDLHMVLRSTICHRSGSRWHCQDLAPTAVARLTQILGDYPRGGTDERINEGNLRIIEELVWVALMLEAAEIIAPDPEAMGWGMLINAIGVVLSAVLPAVGIAMGAVSAGVAAVGAAITAVTGISTGALVLAVQAAIGAAIFEALSQAGVVQWINDESGELTFTGQVLTKKISYDDKPNS
jgi:hypothetical protein